MATPTPSTAAQPNSASKRATDHVTTPSRLNHASPAPRSIPSPAATRKDQAGKTPTNHPTASSFGSKTLGGTPMVQSLSQTGLTTSSSPGVHNAGFTPSALQGLGVDLGTGTPGRMNMSTPLGGVAMDLTMSDLGMSATGGHKRNEDEERRLKLRKVLKNIGRRKGRVSKEGLDRVARRLGFENSVDTNEVVMAGKRTIVTVACKDEMVQDVKADVYPDGNFTGNAELHEYQAPIGSVLLRDLNAPDGVLLRTNLDRFALNLDRLARLDRMSTEVSCFAATDGLFKSLKRLHELEEKAVRELHPGKSSNVALNSRHEAMRKRSGRPTLHARDRIGLALDYWSTEESSPQVDEQKSASAMDIDSATNGNDTKEDDAELFSLRIEAEKMSNPMYSTLRVSNAWLPDTFELPAADSLAGIPWNDPSPTYISEASADAQGDSMAIDQAQRLPNLTFVAKLDPPLVIPYQTAVTVFNVQQSMPFAMYHTSLLGKTAQASQSANAGLHAQQAVVGMKAGQEVEVQHRYTLDVSKADYGFTLEKIPFSHPRELVDFLPTLRQWAHAGALIRNAMRNVPINGKAAINGTQAGTTGNAQADIDLDSLLQTTQIEEGALDVDIELSTSPQPTISVVFPDAKSSRVISVTVQILTNADIMVTNYEGIDEEGVVEEGASASGDVSQTATAKKIAKALAMCGDLGVWIEWLRSRSSQAV